MFFGYPATCADLPLSLRVSWTLFAAPGSPLVGPLAPSLSGHWHESSELTPQAQLRRMTGIVDGRAHLPGLMQADEGLAGGDARSL
jgi:hypothetical protein